MVPSAGTRDEADVLSGLPKGVRRTVELFMTQMIRSGATPSPFWDKVTPEHVPLLIDSMDRTEKLNSENEQKGRVFSLVYCALGIGLLVFLVVYLGSSNPDLLEKVITIGLGFIGGFGSGYGYRALKSRRE
jgi:hypothetical protein